MHHREGQSDTLRAPDTDDGVFTAPLAIPLAGSATRALVNGALFGLLTYATYGLTYQSPAPPCGAAYFGRATRSA